MQDDAPKAAGHNGCQQITRPSREMGAGLKSQEATTRKGLRVEHPKWQSSAALTRQPMDPDLLL